MKKLQYFFPEISDKESDDIYDLANSYVDMSTDYNTEDIGFMRGWLAA